MYKYSYISKETKEIYSKHEVSRRKKIEIAVFTALIAFGIHLILQSLYRSVLVDEVNHIMQKSHFSTLSIYIIIKQIYQILYFRIYYEYISFAEILHNRWYVLVKNGFKPTSMILAKVFYFVLEELLVYTLGFMITFVLSLFLRYPIVTSYLLPLYLSGLLYLTLIKVLTMAASLFFKYKDDIRYTILVVAIFVYSICYALGFLNIGTSRDILAKGFVVFSPKYSLFPLVSIVLIFASVIFIYLKAKKISNHTNHEMYNGDMDFDKKYKIVLSKDGDFSKLYSTKENKYGKEKITDIIVSSVLILMMFILTSINILILLISLASPEKEIDIFGYIPYIFHSETMEETIMYNDLAIFHVVSDEYIIKENDIVLFKDNSENVTVARVINIDEKSYEVDVDVYPVVSVEGSLRSIIDEEQIYGIYTGKSRWIGALVLFANTTIGRILMLILPAIILFYYKPIRESLKNKKGG